MARRSHHSHAIKGGEVRYWEANSKYPGRPNSLVGPTWCGESHGYTSLSSFDPDAGEDAHAYSRRIADCPKCAAALGKARLAQIADRVKVEAVEIPTTSWGKKYRSLNKVIIDGLHVGWIVMQNGWGNPWTLHQLAECGFRPDGDYGPQISVKTDHYDSISADATFQPVHSAARDMMASAALRARDMGHLPTAAEWAASEADRKAREDADRRERDAAREAAAKERERKSALREERKHRAIEALESIGSMKLSNMQRVGLIEAIQIIQGKDVE